MQILLFCTIYGPSCAILVLCYAYIYVLARYHARAIYTVEISIRQGGTEHITVSRYGQTLAITVGCFICLWMPFQVIITTNKHWRPLRMVFWFFDIEGLSLVSQSFCVADIYGLVIGGKFGLNLLDSRVPVENC